MPRRCRGIRGDVGIAPYERANGCPLQRTQEGTALRPPLQIPSNRAIPYRIIRKQPTCPLCGYVYTAGDKL